MNGVHDMGGMQNLGALKHEVDEPVFHHVWEGRVHALLFVSPARSNIDAARYQRDMIPGAEYLGMSYYERWFHYVRGRVIREGFATPTELANGHSDATSPRGTPRLLAGAVEATLKTPLPYVREAPAPPLFAPRDRVRARDLNPDGHTRLPRYVRGRVGTIERYHGAHVFPDSNAHGKGEDPQPLYTVRFTAQTLWGEAANPRDTVCLALWEAYLEHA